MNVIVIIIIIIIIGIIITIIALIIIIVIIRPVELSIPRMRPHKNNFNYSKKHIQTCGRWCFEQSDCSLSLAYEKFAISER